MLASSAQGLNSWISPQNCLANMLYRQCLWLLLISSSVKVGIKLSLAHVSCWVALRAGSRTGRCVGWGKRKPGAAGHYWPLQGADCSLRWVPEQRGSRQPHGLAGGVTTALPPHGSVGVSPARTSSPTENRIWAVFKWVTKVGGFLYSWDISFSSHRNKTQQMCLSSILIRALTKHTAENGNSSN